MIGAAKGHLGAGKCGDAHTGARAAGVVKWKDRQHSVADEFQFFAAMLIHGCRDTAEIRVDGIKIGLGDETLGEFDRPAQLGIENGAVYLLSVATFDLTRQHLLAADLSQIGF